MSERVVVTGAGGQLGQYLRVALQRSAYSVTGVGYRPTNGVDIIADITDADAVRHVLERLEPSCVFHLAAMTDVDGCERDPERARRINELGSRTVAAATRDHGAHLIALSTDYVFGQTPNPPHDEYAPTSPTCVYGRTKLDGELAVQRASPRFAVVRTSWVYGGIGKHFARTVLTMLRTHGSMDVVTDEISNPTFAGDLASSLVILMKERGAGIFHLVGSGACSRYDLAREVADIAGFDRESIRPTTTAEFLRKHPLPARRPENSSLQNTRGAAKGIILRSWKEALAEYVPYLAAEYEALEPPIKVRS